MFFDRDLPTDRVQTSERVIADVQFNLHDFRELNKPGLQGKDSSKDVLPPVEIVDKHQTSGADDAAAKEALKIYSEKGPKAAVEYLQKDLANYEQSKIDDYKHVAGFDDATAKKLATESSQERWDAIKAKLQETDPNALDKMKVAYVDTTLRAMDDSGGRYGDLENYGISGKQHFVQQTEGGRSPMVREFAKEVAKEYKNIADNDGDDLRISKRDLDAWKAEHRKTW